MKQLFTILTVLLLTTSPGWTIGDNDRIEDLIDTEITTIDDLLDTEMPALTDSVDANAGGIAFEANPPAGIGYVAVVVDYSVAAWQDATTNEVLIFPDNVEMEFWLEIYDSTELVCTGATDSTFFMFAGALRIVDVLTGTAGAAAEFDAYERIEWPIPRVWEVDGGALTKQNPAPNLPVMLPVDGTAGHPIFHGINRGVDMGYELQGAGSTGIMVWVCRYRPLRGKGAVTAGEGGTL